MNVVKMIPLLITATVWRATGLRFAGRALVRSLQTEDEEARTVAGMMLVKGGKKAEPLLEEALEKRENVPILLTVLASLGDPAVEPQLRRFMADEDPRISKAARDALELVQHKA